MIPALVLTAGLATRLRPLSLVRAKAALPVAGEPLARRVLQWLSAAGVTDAVLNLHHLPHTLTSLVGDGSDLGMRVRYSWETPVLGSAGGPKRAVPLLQDSTFVVVNGDTLTDVDVAGVVRHHRENGALVTMAVVPNAQPDKYGGVAVDDRGVVTGFVKRGAALPSFHFFGVQVAEADAFAGVPDDTPYESVGALYPTLIQSRPGAIRACHTRAEFLDIGTPGDYLDTALLIARREGRDDVAGARVHVEAGARVERSVLWDDVMVEAGAVVLDCVVADGACIPAGTSWQRVTIRPTDGDLTPGERRIGDLAIRPL
jgi:NDP-sugar pyrophosphorylase family protein